MIIENLKDTAITDALKVAFQYGQIDGSHHKAWVIDQMIRALCITDEAYRKLVAIYEMPEEGNDPDDGYKWDEGIAP